MFLTKGAINREKESEENKYNIPISLFYIYISARNKKNM